MRMHQLGVLVGMGLSHTFGRLLSLLLRPERFKYSDGTEEISKLSPTTGKSPGLCKAMASCLQN